MACARWSTKCLLALTALLALPVAAKAASPYSSSSAALLLSPRVHLGQRFTWNGLLTTSYVYKAIVKRSSQSMDVSCSVGAVDSGSFTASRWVRLFIDEEHGQPAGAGSVKGRWAALSSKGSIIIRGGRAFRSKDKPLDEDPICKFYSTAWFGTPPASLQIGTTWNFQQPSWIPGLVSKERGTVRVIALDAMKGITKLRIEGTFSQKRKIVERVEMTVIDGGVIEAETWLSDYTETPEIGPIHHSFVWNLRDP